MKNKEEQTKCKHDEWLIEREAGTTMNGHLPALWRCKKCDLILTTSERKDLKLLKKRKKEGPLPGVFIVARRIKNKGEISSEGPEARTEIITEDYKGTGSIKSRIIQRKLGKNWLVEHLKEITIGIIIIVAGGLILNRLLK